MRTLIAVAALCAAFLTSCSKPSSSNDPSSCEPECGSATCGDDGCGGSCGECSAGEICAEGVCTSCGNGEVDPDETCDPSAEVACAREEWCESEGCFTAQFKGSEASCDAECVTTQTIVCRSGDDCCPTGCNPGNDADCAGENCGNGRLDPGESCDPPAVPCPDDCGPTQACEEAEFWGFAEACTLTCMREEITACKQYADGCCPAGCTEDNDPDCVPAVCGNAVLEGVETCDSGLTWPEEGSCSPDCDDNRSCTVDLMNGAVADCDVTCTHAPRTDCVAGDGCCPPGCEAADIDCADVTCGDGNVDGAEGCDSAVPAGEPGSCPLDVAECDDGDPCTDDTLEGSAADCSAVCRNTPKPCGSGDGCCPYVCTPDNDNECQNLNLCENYCLAATTYCTGNYQLFASETECNDACAQMAVGREGDSNGNSIYCRIHHLQDARTDPEGHCEHAGAEPLGGCE